MPGGGFAVRQRRSESSGYFAGFVNVPSALNCSECHHQVGWFFKPKVTADASEVAPAEAFCAFQMQRIYLVRWGVDDVLNWHVKTRARNQEKHPAAVPSDSLLRLQILQTQAELYADLLQKHKDQSDVQRQLLTSLNQRLQTREEKIDTMQQIIDAQREQLQMQTKHITFQDRLLLNHKEQVLTQQLQIEAEQRLLGEQNKTIHEQLQQLRLLHRQLELHLQHKRERLAVELPEIQRDGKSN
jgi:hypothetical protein